MRFRDVARVICSLALVGGTVVTAVSCGGSGGANGGAYDGSVMGDGSLHFGDGGNKNTCKPGTCAALGFSCGPNADGCGGLLQCGTCSGVDYCGGGGFSKCGNPALAPDGAPLMPCVPKTCASLPAGTCGQQSDGCGGLTAACGADDAGVLCPAGQFCGGGGPNLCGTGTNDAGGDAGVCVPKTCADYASGTCGQQSDGCGHLTANCTTCVNPQFCGGGTTPGTCGGNNGLGPDGGPIVQPCTKKTCADYASGTCGIQADGCGGTVGPCTTCTSPAFCGGGGPSLCGGDAGAGSSSGGGTEAGGPCTPQTCANYPTGTCGAQSDGCGGLTANCGTCTNPQFCGGGGPGLCGGNDGRNPDGSIINTCQPATCGSRNCGQTSNGCGGILSCGGTAPSWGCQPPQACGAGGQANVCGSNLSCTGLCTQQVACDGGALTTLKGTVVAGTIATYLCAAQTTMAGCQAGAGCTWNGTTCTGSAYGDPVPNVLVYVPNGAVTAFTPRANETQTQQCSTCGADVTGNPLVLTKTAYDGTFTLSNVPVGGSIPIVIQLGRWRRQFTVSVATSCGVNTVNAAGMPAGFLRMPRTQAEGDIPLTAISTGDVDALECVLLKMGIDSSEFTLNSTTTPKNGRVHMYQGNGAASSLGATPSETALMGTTTANGTYNNYDQVILPCWGVDPTTNGSANAKSAAALANLVTYGTNGGHFFATHYSYAWLYNNNPYSTTAAWNVNHNTGINSMTGVVSQTVPPTTPATNPGVFVEWLNYIQALSNFTAAPPPPNPADVTIANARHDVNNVLLQSVDWIDGNEPAAPNGDGSAMLLHYTFDTPVGAAAQCGHAIFSDFHVSNSATGTGQCNRNNNCSSNNCNGGGNCVAAQFPSQANLATYCGQRPMTAQEKILEYMIWDLASCVPGQPTSTCTPKTCSAFPGTCGQQGDGCGGLTPDCNPCPAGQACGACGTPGVCCTPDGGSCAAKTCNDYPNLCGQQSDGCGGLTNNCPCPTGQTCGGGGVAGHCGSPPPDGGPSGCTPLTCSAPQYVGVCGQQADGCGGLTMDCNPCPMGQTCGGCGVPGQCCTPPSSSCTPQPCPANLQCGPASDGCGNIIASCGTCTAPQTCGGCGVPGQCCGTSGCVPQTCAQQGISCGPAGDGCGNLIPGGCGMCTPPQTCGGGGTSGVCGGGGTCTPKTCAQLGVECGPTGDGCGNLIPTCGTCAPPQSCGGGGQGGKCGMPIAQ